MYDVADKLELTVAFLKEQLNRCEKGSYDFKRFNLAIANCEDAVQQLEWLQNDVHQLQVEIDILEEEKEMLEDELKDDEQ